jgi:hypothetical protein
LAATREAVECQTARPAVATHGGSGHGGTLKRGRERRRASRASRMSSEGASGAARILLIASKRQGHAVAVVGHAHAHGGHALDHVSAVEANHRARGVRASVRLGGHVWASYGPNWAMGLKAILEPTRSSTILIKEPWSLVL